jgi:signal transduction histidine kinase/ActR/RegA family two-component response regulator
MTILLHLMPITAIVFCIYLATYLHAQRNKSRAMLEFMAVCYLAAGLYILSFIMFFESAPANGIFLAHCISALAMITAGRLLVFTYAFIDKKSDSAFWLCHALNVTAAAASPFLSIHAVPSAILRGEILYTPGALHGLCFTLGLTVPLLWSGGVSLHSSFRAEDQLYRLRAKYLCTALLAGLALAITFEVVLPLVFKIDDVTQFMAVSSICTLYLIFRAVIHHRFLNTHAEEIEAVTRRLFADLTESIIIFDTQGTVVQSNAASKDLLRLKSTTITGKMIHDFLPGYRFERSYHDQPFKSTVNGAEQIIRISQSAIKDSTVVLGKILIMRDVTDQERMEHELVRSRQYEMLGLLAGGIAHDFNNFLTGMMANFSLIRKFSSADPQSVELAADGEKAAVRAAALVNQLLTFSKGGTPAREALQAKELIEDTVRFALAGRNARCEFRLPPDLMPIMADRSQMSQVFQNLAINAAEAMPQGGTMVITGSNYRVETGNDIGLAGGDYLEIAVSDRGEGIPQERLDRIFEPFFTTKPKGKGLGLSIVYSILKRHGGSIKVSSLPGEGTTFTLLIPASHDAAKTEGKPAVDAPHATGTILIMEDEPSVRKALNVMLLQGGYRAESAQSGAMAIEMFDAALAAGRRFDAVITDLTVPGGMGGKELAVELHKRAPDLPIIVMSGYREDSAIAHFAEHGFAASIKKPFGYQDIESTLAAVLRGRRTAPVE